MNVALSLHLSVHVEYKSYAIKNLENVKDYIVWSFVLDTDMVFE